MPESTTRIFDDQKAIEDTEKQQIIYNADHLNAKATTLKGTS